MMDLCKYRIRCWRFLYSIYFLKKPYDIPPTRLNLVLAGYGTLSLLPKKGLYCENMPRLGREDLLCPNLKEDMANIDCFEYTKEKEKEKKKEERKERYFPNKEKRTFIPKEWRIRVVRDAKFKCFYCGRYQNQKDEIGRKIRMVVDHFFPLALGGTSTIDNLVCSCWECNTLKGANIWEHNSKVGFYPEYQGAIWN